MGAGISLDGFPRSLLASSASTIASGVGAASSAASAILESHEGPAASRGLLVSVQDAPLSATAATSRGSEVPSFSMGELSIAEHSSILDSILDSVSTARSAQDVLPQSLPFSEAMPAAPAAGGFAGGSATSSGGAGGLDLGGVLAALLASLLGGKFVWYARKFLKPNSAFHLIVNQPG